MVGRDSRRSPAEQRLPTVCEWRKVLAAGCLIGYGPDLAEFSRRALLISRVVLL